MIMLVALFSATAFAQDTVAVATQEQASKQKAATADKAAANGKDLADQANAAYQRDDFNSALSLYEQAAKEDGTSSLLYYNMGNTHYRLGNMGKAVLCYERALLLDPSNDDARTNLEFVNDKLQLKIDRGSSFVSDTIGGFVRSIASDTWAHLGIATFILLLVAVLVYIFAEAVILRKIGFFGGVKEAKFRRQVVPGDTLRLEVEIIKVKGPVGVGKGVATVNGEKACSAEISFAIK